MGGLCTCCRPQVPKDRNSSIKYHGSILRRKTSISAAFSFETPTAVESSFIPTTPRNGPLPTIPSTLDINTATEEDLMTLPNIGRATAHNIVEYRKQIGRFKRIEDLVLVSGVGAIKLEKLRKEIHVGGNFTRAKKPSISASDSSTSLLVNINSASPLQLCSLEGITESTASKIVAYRNEYGVFEHINDLVEPAGLIDTPTLLKIKSFLSIDKTGGRHSRNVSSASSKLRNGSYSNFTAFGPESMESSRMKVEPFASTKDGRPIVRIATWNLQQCTNEKVKNPGVREVICATILENGIKILAVQELADQEALQHIVDELNSPTLPNIQRLWSAASVWECAVSSVAGYMFQGSEYNGFIFDKSAAIELYSSALLEKPKRGKEFARRPFLGYFKVNRMDVVLVSVHLKAVSHAAGDSDMQRLNKEIQSLPALVEALYEHISEEKDVVILGDFNLEPDKSEFDVLRNELFTSVVPETTPTNISTKNMKGSRSYDNMWLSQSVCKLFTARHHVVRNGLTNPWIPDGWSWGGVPSDHCPVWAEFFVDKDFDADASDKSLNGLKLKA